MSGTTEPKQYKFYLGIDIGTTRTNVSYIRLKKNSKRVAQWVDVVDIGHWNPNTPSEFKGPGRQVPTESRYKLREKKTVHGWEATKSPITSSSTDDFVHISRAKPLAGYPEDGNWPQPLQDKLTRLKEAGLIKNEEDVDVFEVSFMRWVFSRVKETLAKKGYTDDSEVNIYICCPVAWVQKDRRRFRMNMARAVREAKMGKTFTTQQGYARKRGDETVYELTECDDMSRVRVLTETEAAALYLVATTESQDLGILPGSTIITGDIGGGTVDFSCFKLSDDKNPRLQRQMCPSSGGPCGSLNMNDNMALFFEEKLRDKYSKSELQEMLENTILPHFENHIKPSMFFEDIESLPPWDFYIRGVEWYSEDAEPMPNHFRVSAKDMWEHVFEPVFEEIAELLTKQIHLARKASPTVSDIWFYGGGADQPYLRPYLRKRVLDVENRDSDVKLKLNESPQPNVSGTFVSKGAALAAATPKSLPERFNQTSYGFMLDLPVGPGENLSIEEAKKRGKIETLDDGESYLPDCVVWILEHGQSYGPNTKFKPIERVDTYFDNESKWIAKLFVVLKDDKVQQNYPLTHPHNLNHTIRDIMQTADLKPLYKNKLQHTWMKRSGRNRKRYDIRSIIRPRMIGMDLVLDVMLVSDVGNVPGTQVKCLYCDDINGTLSYVQVGEECARCRYIEGTLFSGVVDISSNALLEKTYTIEDETPAVTTPKPSRRQKGKSQASAANHVTSNSSARRPRGSRDLPDEDLGVGSSQPRAEKRPRLASSRQGVARYG